MATNIVSHPHDDKPFYSEDGLSLRVSPDEVRLSYTSHGREIRRAFSRGRAPRGREELLDREAGLRVFYDLPIESWVIVHTRSNRSAKGWRTDTIFVPDNGKPYMTHGITPAKPGSRMWLIFMGVLFVGTIVVGLGYWITILARSTS